jgi:hypothetical protein
MKTNYKKKPRIILGYLMVLAMALFTTNVNGQCTPNGATCVCPMIYNPVCGCDGVLYSNDCIATCQGVAYTAPIPNGSGGFLPCAVTPPQVPGCTDSLATNYNPTATVDDGSCTYTSSGCSIGIGANSESFEDPAVGLYGQGPWADWLYDAATSTFTGTNGWRKDNLGTGSIGTGPVNGQPSFDGDYYLYCETSGQYSKVANLVSSCVDLTNFTQPAFVFAYHMLGATIGTFNVDVSTDGGITWNNEFTKTGDQGSAWLEGIVDLSINYSGMIVQVRMNYTSGTSYTGDCAIDYLRFMESPIAGCMDAFAFNYNSLATIDDGSCLYPGCIDPFAVNYNATANADCDSIFGGTSTTCCVYPTANIAPFCEDWESASTSTNSWLVLSGTNSSVTLNAGTFNVNPASQVIGPLNDTVSLLFEGADVSSTWNTGNTEVAAYSNTSNIASAIVTMDLSQFSGPCEMSFNLELYSGFSNARYSNMRIKVNGVVVPDIAGNTSYWSGTGSPWFPWAAAGAPHAALYDMSAYAGQSNVAVEFEFVGRYSTSYSSGFYGNLAQIDNICFYEVTPCFYFAASTSVDAEPACNGDSTGAVSVSAANGSGAYSYIWDNGATSDSISGILADTYMVIASDDTLGCIDTTFVTINQPSALSVTGIIVPTSTPVSNNGAIDITISGGTPCIVSASLNTHNPAHSSNGQSGIHFNIVNTSVSPLTVTGFSQGNYSSYLTNNMSAWYIP